MIDRSQEQILSITAAAKSLPGRPCIQTIYRWCRNGIKGIRLETLLIGGRRYTSAEALDRFAAAVTAAAAGERLPVRTTAARTKAQAKADEELRAAGFGK